MKIHPTAIIDPKAEVDDSVEIGPYCVIEGHVRIGAGCRLYHNVFLTGWTEIGEACVLHPGVIVGHEPQDTGYTGERTYCRVGANCVLREYVTIHRGTIPESETAVGEGCFLLSGSHVAHNCRIGDRVTLINNVMLAGHVEVGDDAVFGGGAGVHQFVHVGSRVMVHGNARVSQDIPPYAMVDADGKVVGLNKVGLRRAGMTPEEMLSLRQAYRTLFFRHEPFADAVARLACEADSEPAKRILAFVQRDSQRGFAGRARS